MPDHCSQLTIPREFYKDGTDKTETVLIMGLWTTACCTACLIWYHSCTFHFLPTIFGPVRYKSTPSPALSLLHSASSPSCRQVGQKWIPGEGFLPASPPAPCLAHLLLPHAWHQDQVFMGANSLHPFLTGLMSLALNISCLSGIDGNLRFLYGDDVSDSLRFKEAASGN